MSIWSESVQKEAQLQIVPTRANRPGAASILLSAAVVVVLCGFACVLGSAITQNLIVSLQPLQESDSICVLLFPPFCQALLTMLAKERGRESETE